MKRTVSTIALVTALQSWLSLAGSVAAGGQVPFKGTMTEGPPISVVPLEPFVVRMQEHGTGNATHLGRFELDFWVVINFATSTSFGQFEFTAANGDTLNADFTGHGFPTEDPDVLRFVEIATITGGTGRFAGATGGFTREGLSNRATGLAFASFEGTIATPGAGSH